MNSRIAFAVIAAALVLDGCAHEREAVVEPRCPPVKALTAIPAGQQRGLDPAFDSLRYDPACETVLLNAVQSNEPMRDPRPVPPEPRFAVGDAALFILLAKHEVALEDVLPAAVADKLPSAGMKAYFDYVAVPLRRAEVVDSFMKILRDRKNRQ